MVHKNLETQRTLQNAIRAAGKSLGGEKLYCDEFAKACIELDINQHLEDDKIVEPWIDGDYVIASKTFFRRLGMKEPHLNPFQVDFVNTVKPALILAMPEKIKLEYLNSMLGGLGVHVVVRSEAQDEHEIESVKLSAMKEAGEAIAAIAPLTTNSNRADKAKFTKEANELITAMKKAIAVVNEPNFATVQAS